MPENWTNIKEALPREVERCKALMEEWANGGAAHTAPFHDLKLAIKRADTAISHQDPGGMARSYLELQGFV